jgi:DNA-binding protein HU-beta
MPFSFGKFYETFTFKIQPKEKRMKKDDLVTFVSQRTGITRKAAGETIHAVLEGIASALEKGDSISLIGFGGFKVVERSARQGRNPQTGETIHIQASKAVKFTAGKVLKQRVQ